MLSINWTIRFGFALAAALFVVATQARPSSDASVNSSAKLQDTSSGSDWPGFGRTYGEQHYSPLTEINAQTIGRLGLAWSMDLGQGNTTTGPIAVDGTLYFAMGYSVVYAVDAASSNLLWTYDPKAAEVAGKNLRVGWGSRGIAWWNEKVYTGTQDGRLIAIDAKTGKQVWSVQTFDPASPSYISGAPRVFDGRVAIGNANDIGVMRNYVTAYDAESGEQLWRFFTVPGNPADGFENEAMEKAAKTWSGEWWKFGGGGAVWNAMTYDSETETFFIDTGNGYPYSAMTRTNDIGDNLYTCSIIALDANTGDYKWHYQFNPRDTWDYDAIEDMELADLHIGGKARKVLMTAPKNGFFYIFDRLSGELLSAEPFAKVTWASHIDLKTGRPVEHPAARFPNGTTVDVWPSAYGAHNWLPMAYSIKTNLVYIPVVEMGMTVTDAGHSMAHWQAPTDRSGDNTLKRPYVDEARNQSLSVGKLLAWNPVSQKPAWSAPQPSFATGGVLATAGGLVFQGAMDGKFNAYADMTGKRLWSFDQETPILAPPISYEADGKQYVTVLSGLSTSFGNFGPMLAKFHIDPRSQARRVLTFALGGNAILPQGKNPAPFSDDPTFKPNEKSAAAGGVLYGKHCLVCHGVSVVGATHAPDLRRSPIPALAEAFDSVVRGCAMVPAGMPCFEEFTDEQLSDLRHYIRTEMHDSKVGASKAP